MIPPRFSLTHIGPMQISSQPGSVFFGRSRISALLEKRLEAFQKGYRQNIGIIGLPFLGKSILSKVFIDRVIGHPEIIPVHYVCQEYDSFERFSERWMGELLISIYRFIHHTEPDSFQILIRSLKKIIPNTITRMKSVKSLTLHHRHQEAYRELLALTGEIHKELGKKFLMVLDEFHRLVDIGLNDPFGNLGKEIMIQKETMFLVTSSQPARSLSIFREKLSLLFGNFELIELGPFDFDEAIQFMDFHLAKLNLENELKRFLVRLTDGHPYYLDQIIYHLQRAEQKEDLRTNRQRITEILTHELYENRGVLYQHFQSQFYQIAHGRPWPLFADVLLAIALGHKKLSQMSRFLHQKTNNLKKIIEKLLFHEIIQKHGSFYQIHDPLFRFWLAKAYCRQRFMGERLPLARLEGFKQELNQAIEESIREDKRELPKRIVELFLNFRNDVVELNHKKFKCPHFTEILSRPNNGRVFPVFARNGKTRWLCQVLSGQVTEDDVHTFLQDNKRLRGSIQKKLMIGLQGIELNAKLLAQEAKIQYLDLRSLNSLLDLYDKPKIVL